MNGKQWATAAVFGIISFLFSALAGLFAVTAPTWVDAIVKSGSVIGWIAGLAWFVDPQAKSAYVHPVARKWAIIGLLFGCLTGLVVKKVH